MKLTRCPDSHRCVVFVSAFMCVVLTISYTHSFGRLYVALIERFNSSRAETAVVQSTTAGVFMVVGILTGSVVQRFGPMRAGFTGAMIASLAVGASFLATSVKFLIVTQGICLGIGTSLVFISSSATVGQIFGGESRLLALSLLSCGSGVGGMVYPYLLDILLESYGLNGTFLIVGGMIANTAALSLLWNIKPEKQKADHDKAKDKTVNSGVSNSSYVESDTDINSNNNGLQIIASQPRDTTNGEDNSPGNAKRRLSVWMIERVYSQFKPKEKAAEGSSQKRSQFVQSLRYVLSIQPFVFCTIGLAVANPTINVFRVLFTDSMQDAGLSESDISLGLLLLNVFSTIGRLAIGGIQQFSSLSPLAAPLLATILGTGGMALMVFTKTFAPAILACCINGLVQGMIFASFTVTSARLVGKEHLPTALGLTFTFNAVGNTVAPPISGFIRDSQGSYRFVFISSAIAMATGCVILIFAKLLEDRTRRLGSRKVSIYITKL